MGRLIYNATALFSDDLVDSVIAAKIKSFTRIPFSRIYRVPIAMRVVDTSRLSDSADRPAGKKKTQTKIVTTHTARAHLHKLL